MMETTVVSDEVVTWIRFTSFPILFNIALFPTDDQSLDHFYVPGDVIRVAFKDIALKTFVVVSHHELKAAQELCNSAEVSALY